MASPSAGVANPVDLVGMSYLQTTPQKPVAYIATALLLFFCAYAMQGVRGKAKLPFLNPKGNFELSDWRVRGEFMAHGIQSIVKARKKYGKEPFRVNADAGEVVLFPGDIMQEIRNNPDLSFTQVTRADFHAYLPGFEPASLDEGVVRVINARLTKALNKITIMLSREASTGWQKLWTDSTEWHEVVSLQTVARVITRMSTRVFLGEEMCDNEEWVEAVAHYSRIANDAIAEYQRYPYLMRRIVHWFHPSARELRRALGDVRRNLQPLLEKRKKMKAEAAAQGEPALVFDDTLEWFEKEYAGRYDPAEKQITLSMVAVDTTSDLLQQTMLQLAKHPEHIQTLRNEVIQVLRAQGLKKVALNNLKFMDAVIKESQRLKPLIFSIRRAVNTDLKLKNGLVIKKGEKIMIDNTNMWSEEYYDEPEKFNPYRFMEWRQGEKESVAHLVSTSEMHMGFGHGKHACPGRFFAANEIKVALCHAVLKYDWKLPEGHDPKNIELGSVIFVDPTTRFIIRRRQEELDMADLEVE